MNTQLIQIERIKPIDHPGQGTGIYRSPRFWVYEGEICRAAQATLNAARCYMKPGRIIKTHPRPHCPSDLI